METKHIKNACSETLIVSLLRDRSMHGYEMGKEIAKRSGGYFTFKHSTLYPILHKLEKHGLIDGEWSDDGPRARRKKYRLTSKGRRYAAAQRESWQGFMENFARMLRSGPNTW